MQFNIRSYIEGATPAEVFAAMNDPEGLQAMLPRMRKVEFSNRTENQADVVMSISIGSTFGVIRCEGTLTWVEPQELTFKVRSPLPVETTWKLDPAVNGTELNVTMNLNLVPLLGPMASFVPTGVVEGMMQKELKHAIEQIAKRAQSNKTLKAKAVAA